MDAVTIFDEAEQIVNGDRQADYGHPRDNHRRTAILWNAYIKAKRVSGHHTTVLDETDVCWLNVLQKIARELNAPKRDNKVDVVGYVRNIEMMEEL